MTAVAQGHSRAGLGLDSIQLHYGKRAWASTHTQKNLGWFFFVPTRLWFWVLPGTTGLLVFTERGCTRPKFPKAWRRVLPLGSLELFS